MMLMFGFMVFAASPAKAQQINSLPEITMDEAVNKAMANYPILKSARLEIEQQEALKKTAWNLGNTQIFTGGEELGENNEGVYTSIGVQQQDIDVFGIVPRLKVQKQKVALAEAALYLDELGLRQQVKQAYAAAYVAKRNLELYESLDSVYQEFQRAAQIRYEVEETSRLAFLAASNQVKQITLQKEQVEYDYTTALTRLNLWLVSDIFYTVTTSAQESWMKPSVLMDSIAGHPLLQIAEQRINVAEAEKKAARAGLLPRLNAQYGAQEIGGQSGYYQFQVGISIPLSFLPQQGRVQSAKIQRRIAEQGYRQMRIELQAEYQSLLQQYQKWLASWRFYQNEALPLAREQRRGAVLAYQEGAIDYVSFIQNLKETVQIEIDSQEALDLYLKTNHQN